MDSDPNQGIPQARQQPMEICPLELDFSMRNFPCPIAELLDVESFCYRATDFGSVKGRQTLVRRVQHDERDPQRFHSSRGSNTRRTCHDT